jgi:uncharacterized membrane protein (UPF0182 family)
VANAAEFFSTVSFWDVPSDPTVQGAATTGAAGSAQPPYYVLAGLPDQEGATFQLTSALVSRARQFLSAYVSANSDPATYGKITVLELPAETQTLGPQQVQALFLGTPQVSQEIGLLSRQGQTIVDYGNLLTLPVAGGLLYVEPVYIERAGQGAASYPVLARVLVSYNGQVGFAPSLDRALEQVFGAGAGRAATPTPGQQPTGPAPADGAAPTTPPGGAGTASPELAAAATDIQNALTQLKAAQQAGDFEAQGQALAALDAAVQRFQQANGQVPATPGG